VRAIPGWRVRAQWLPVLILVCVALNQQRLAHTAHLSPWSGGGFGMFSTTDAPTDRHLHVYALSPSLRRELSLPAALEEEGRRALSLPSERRLHKLAGEIRASLKVPATTGIEIHVWATRYNPGDLRPGSYLLRQYRDDHAR
jgi:hypothetical protein